MAHSPTPTECRTRNYWLDKKGGKPTANAATVEEDGENDAVDKTPPKPNPFQDVTEILTSVLGMVQDDHTIDLIAGALNAVANF